MVSRPLRSQKVRLLRKRRSCLHGADISTYCVTVQRSPALYETWPIKIAVVFDLPNKTRYFAGLSEISGIQSTCADFNSAIQSNYQQLEPKLVQFRLQNYTVIGSRNLEMG